MGAVDFDGSDADAEFIRDDLVLLPLEQPRQHFVFSLSQPAAASGTRQYRNVCSINNINMTLMKRARNRLKVGGAIESWSKLTGEIA
jgi:hypothetical protein